MIPLAEVDVDRAMEEIKKLMVSKAKVRIYRQFIHEELHHDGVIAQSWKDDVVWCNGWSVNVRDIVAITKIRKSQSKLRFGPGFYKERQLLYEPTMKLSSVDDMVKKLLGAHG